MRLNVSPSRRTDAHTSRSLFSTTASGTSPPFISVSRSRSIVRRSTSVAPNTSSTSPCSSTLCRFCQRSSYDWYWKSGARFPEPYLGRGVSVGALGELTTGDVAAAGAEAVVLLASVTGWTALPSVVARPGPAASKVIANHDANDTAFPLVSRSREIRRGERPWSIPWPKGGGCKRRAITIRSDHSPQVPVIASRVGHRTQGRLAHAVRSAAAGVARV